MSLLIGLLLLFITLLPKITIISVNNSVTGVRFEDFLILLCTLSLIIIKKGKSNDEQKQLYFRKIKKIMYIYLFLSSISTFYGLVNGYISLVSGVLFLIRKLEYFLLFYIGYYNGNKINNNEEKFFNFIVLSHFILCILQLNGLLGSFNHGEMLSTLTQGRVSSTFNGAYEMSAFLLILLPFYFYKLLFLKNKILKNLFYIGLITFCIIVSYSRTSLLLEFAIFVLMIHKSKILKNKKSLMNTVVIVSIIIMPLFILFAPKMDLSRFDNLSYKKTSFLIKYTWNNRDFDTYLKTGSWYGTSNYSLNEIASMGYDGSLYMRISHWMQLLDGWTSSPFIGCGVSVAGNSADGNYIKILSETGLLGLISWICLLFVIYNSIKQSNWLKYSFITIIIGALVIDLFDSSKIIMMFWFLVGVYLRRINDEDKKYNNN